MGFAALPLLESVPCCGLTIFAFTRISRMHQVHERLSRDVARAYAFDVTTFSVRPSTTSKQEMDDTLQPNPSPHFSSSSTPRAVTSSRPPSTTPGPSATLSTQFLSPVSHLRAESRQYHLPFRSRGESESQGSLVSANPAPRDVHIRVNSLASSALPTTTPLDHADNNEALRRASPYIAPGDGGVESESAQEDDQSSFNDRASSVVFRNHSPPKLEQDKESGITEEHRTDEDPRYASQYFLPYMSQTTF